MFCSLSHNLTQAQTPQPPPPPLAPGPAPYPAPVPRPPSTPTQDPPLYPSSGPGPLPRSKGPPPHPTPGPASSSLPRLLPFTSPTFYPLSHPHPRKPPQSLTQSLPLTPYARQPPRSGKDLITEWHRFPLLRHTFFHKMFLRYIYWYMMENHHESLKLSNVCPSGPHQASLGSQALLLSPFGGI